MKKGFLLLETIVVVSVLCIILISLYVGYNNTTNAIKREISYDNTEYIYKTYILKTYLEDKIINKSRYACTNCESIYIFCSDKTTRCSFIEETNEDYIYLKSMINMMKVQAIYITKWDTTIFTNNVELMSVFEITTQRYIRSLNPIKKDGDYYRIIVMFEDENENNTIYQYASLSFESRIRGVN